AAAAGMFLPPRHRPRAQPLPAAGAHDGMAPRPPGTTAARPRCLGDHKEREAGMSAPQTNLEKQRRRHWAPLLGIVAVTLFALAVIVYWLMEEAANSESQPPAGTEAGTVEEPAQSTIPAETIEPEMQVGEPGDTGAAPP